ncbi:MAG: hypothetical protein WAK17_00870, partial [Candidatus Nitrosopolaris sp.]
NRRTSEAALSVLKEWVKLHGKPNKVMHDGGTEFTSTDFKNFLLRMTFLLDEAAKALDYLLYCPT